MSKIDAIRSVMAEFPAMAQYSETASITELKGGLCNLTYRVTAGPKNFIIQKLHPVITADIVVCGDAITKRLVNGGWSMPPFLCNQEQRPYIEYEGALYRAYPFIDGENVSMPLSASQGFALGEILARLHNDLRDINISVMSGIPHFHDTPYIMDVLSSKKEKFKMLPPKSLELASLALDRWQALRKMQGPAFGDRQIIHGDARIQNYLRSEEGQPFTLIDYDTFMKGSIFIDVGDLLRSVSCDADQNMAVMDWRLIRQILDGYRSASTCVMDGFERHAILGLCLISLELSTRFLTDMVDDNYFGWDDKKYPSRAAHNLARAAGQFDIFEEGLKWLNAGNELPS